MRLKALLVDDEVKILENLHQVLPWQEMDIEVAGTAGTDCRPLEQVELLHPDLILCDIRMPVMDGIAFLEALAGNPGLPGRGCYLLPAEYWNSSGGGGAVPAFARGEPCVGRTATLDCRGPGGWYGGLD